MMRNRFFDCITDFIFLENEPERADVIFVPGGNYPESAKRAAALFAMGYAPYVLPSGRYSKLTGHFIEPETDASHNTAGSHSTAGSPKKAVSHNTEWEYLRDILLECGVPRSAILKEDRATFTWENAICSRRLLDSMGIEVRKGIIVCQAFHARRCSMYYQEQFPETELVVCPVVTKGITKTNWYLDETKIDIVLGEVERCGSQFHDIMKSKLMSLTGCEDHFFDDAEDHQMYRVEQVEEIPKL